MLKIITKNLLLIKKIMQTISIILLKHIIIIFD
jgi:hypothetical protein